jgi:phage shock protein A
LIAKEAAMRILSRLVNLVRGTLVHWIRGREHRNPEAVYEAAIEERRAQYGKLRAAAAGVLYLRGKLTNELERTSKQLARIRGQLDLAVDRDDDAVGLALIGRHDTLDAEAVRLRRELADLTAEAEAEEKVRMLARLANAKARLRFQETLDGLAADADIRALESVREHIDRLVAETTVGRDLGDDTLERRLADIRDAEADAARRAQLEEMKRTRKRGLLPVVLRAESETVKVSARGARA